MHKMLLFCLQILYYAATACINGKVSVSSNNHMMHPLTISGNRHVEAQHRFTVLKEFQGIWGLYPSEAVRFLYPKIDAKSIN